MNLYPPLNAWSGFTSHAELFRALIIGGVNEEEPSELKVSKPLSFVGVPLVFE